MHIHAVPYLVSISIPTLRRKSWGKTPPALTITADPHQSAGIARFLVIQERLQSGAVRCLVHDTPNPPRVLNGLQTGELKAHYIDPVGRQFHPGPALYPRMLQQIADDFRQCLGNS